MKWVNYRDILGIGFSDKEKLISVRNCLVNKVIVTSILDRYTKDNFFEFCMITGKSFYHNNYSDPKSTILEIFNGCKSVPELIANYVAYVNSMNLQLDRSLVFIGLLQSILDAFNIPCEIKSDEDGCYIFPKGAVELDYSLVSEPLTWLSDYPKTKKKFSIALKQYSESVFIRDCADNFRKALEEFLQEFFQNGKNLDNNIHDVGAYLKSEGGSEEIVKILVGLINLYSTLNNKIAKHNDKVDVKFLEFLMYQTGLFIRMLIVVKRESN